jgi:hypothetical protein
MRHFDVVHFDWATATQLRISSFPASAFFSSAGSYGCFTDLHEADDCPFLAGDRIPMPAAVEESP